jgi:hypothetical protein
MEPDDADASQPLLIGDADQGKGQPVEGMAWINNLDRLDRKCRDTQWGSVLCAVSLRRSDLTHTAHVSPFPAALPAEVTIIYPHHPLAGTKLRVVRWTRLEGIVHLVLELVDGSRGCLPAGWTDAFGGETGQQGTVPAFSASGLRQLARLIELLEAR